MSNVILITTRHRGIVEWLARRGIRGEYLRRAQFPSEVEGRVVYGVLPMWLAAHTLSTTFVKLPDRDIAVGKEYTADQLDQLGAYMVTYVPKGNEKKSLAPDTIRATRRKKAGTQWQQLIESQK